MLRSFRARLTLAYLLTFTLVLAVFCGAVYYVHGRHLEQDLDATLETIARAQTAYATDSGTPRPHLHEPAGEAGHAHAPYRIRMQILDSAGRVVDAGKGQNDGPLPLDSTLLDHSRDRQAFGYALTDGRRLRVLCLPFRDRAALHYRLCVAADLGLLEAMQRELLWQQLLIGALALLATAAAGWLLAGWAIRPIERITAAAREISARNLERRIAATPAATELGQLIEVLNETFARLARAIGSHRRFAADASHELRTPLANLKAELRVGLRRDREPEEYRRILRSADEETDRLARLTDDLLLLSTGDQDELALRDEPVPLDELVAESVRHFRPRAAAKGIEIAAELGLGSAAVRGDPDRLRQVLDNLIENALSYSPPGKLVRVQTCRDGAAACLQVCDEGVGIPPEDLPHIFDRFYRADKARSRQAGGSGLGLSICKLLVERHDGTIAAESRPGESSTFTVTLPLDDGSPHRA